MYNGEVEVKQAHLNTFLAVAERLRVRGLCQSGGKSPATRASPPPPSATQTPQANNSTSRRSQTPPSSKQQSSSTSQRRSSLDHGSSFPPALKRPKLDPDSPPTTLAPPGVAAITGAGVSAATAASGEVGESGGSQDEGSLLSRSGAGSEADYGEYGFGAGGGPVGDGNDGGFGADAGAMAGALMGKIMIYNFTWQFLNSIRIVLGMAGMSPRGMLDPAAAKGKKLRERERASERDREQERAMMRNNAKSVKRRQGDEKESAL
jgi:hypothetical protein